MARQILIIWVLLLLGGCCDQIDGYYVYKWDGEPAVMADVHHGWDRPVGIYDTYKEAREECDRLNGVVEHTEARACSKPVYVDGLLLELPVAHGDSVSWVSPWDNVCKPGAIND